MINRVRIQNFKSIRDVTVELSPVTVLVGRSGTGKSAFVEAIRFLRDFLIGKDAHVVRAVWDATRHGTTNSSDSSRFEIDFSIGGIQDEFQYVVDIQSLAHDPFRISEERLKLGARILFSQRSVPEGSRTGPEPIRMVWDHEPQLVKPLQPGPVAISRIPSISDVVTAYTVLTAGVGCYAFHDNMFAEPKPDANHSSSGLSDDAKNYLQTMKDLVENLQDVHVRKQIVGALQQVTSNVSAIELDDIRQPTQVIVGHHIGDKTLELKLGNESAGFRRVYAHLLALYQRPPKQTLIFEHPEDGIHPRELAMLAEEFNAAPENNRGQVILTTHSPQLLNHFSPDQIRVVELDDFETRIGPISAEQYEAISEGFLESGELLTVDLARMAAIETEPIGT